MWKWTVAAGVLLSAGAVRCGAQWEMQDPHVKADLRGIDSVGGGVAWASGSNGTVLRTEDMGFVWQLCATPPGAEKLDFRGVQAFDNNTAIVMSSGKGDLSRLYKTTDGCQTWKLVFKNPAKEGFWDAIAADDRGLWILGDPVNGRFTILHFGLTDNGDVLPGEPECAGTRARRNNDKATRECSPELGADASKEGAFAASNSAFFVLRRAYQAHIGMPQPRGAVPDLGWIDRQFFVSGGKADAKFCERHIELGDVILPPRWECQTLPLGDGTEGSGAFSLFVNRAGNAVTVGGDYLHPDETAHTAAYRRAVQQRQSSWTAAAAFPNGYRSAVAYDEKAKAWITVGPNGTDVSTDDGRNWRTLRPGKEDAPDADKNWNALSLPFVVGPKGRIGILRQGVLARGAEKGSQK